MLRYFCLFSLSFVLLGITIWETLLRLNPQDIETRTMDCLKLGGPEHHFFQENCESIVSTPTGPVVYRMNEDGFRARPRAEFSQGAVAILGDSKVEGWWLDAKDTIGAGLERSGAFGKWRELNLGIRFSGPTIQRLRLQRALAHYPVRAVLWFLNGTDPADERLAFSLAVRRDASGAPLELSHDDVSIPSWLKSLQSLVGNHSAILRSLQMNLYDREVVRRVTHTPEGPEIICSSFLSAIKILKERKIPVIAVLLPLGPNIGKFPYMNIVDREEGSKYIESCITEAEVQKIDMRGRLSSEPSFYWTNHRNMKPEGVHHLLKELTPEVTNLIRPEIRR